MSHTPRSHPSQPHGPTGELELCGDRLPVRLLDLDDRPSRLFLRGELPRGPAVAIVGTRRATPEAEGYARELASELARAGVAVLSGGARGIDAAAHRGALDVGGPTVVVAPAAFDRPYPPEHRGLFEQVIRSGGAYLTFARLGEPARRHVFFVRNAVLAALAHAIVVVECPVQSGARNAAKVARQLGRPVFAVPAVPWNPRGLGCISELCLGARPLGSHRDVLRWLAQARHHPIPLVPGRREASPRSEVGPGPDPQPLLPGVVDPDDLPGRVLAAVHAGARHVDEVCARTGLAPAQVQPAVLTLTLQEVLLSDHTGRLGVRGGRDRGNG